MYSLNRHHPSIRFANRLFVAMLTAVVLVWTGCDSSEETTDDDTDRFIGVWDAVSLTASPLPTNFLGNFELVATFRSNGSVQIVVTDDTGELADINGEFDVDPASGAVTLSSDDFDEDLDMDYEFESDDELKLSFAGSDLGKLGIDLGEFGPIVAGLTLTATLEKRP